MRANADTRQRLIEAVITLLGEHPGEEPTTRKLCEVAQVTAPSLYHHFGDKNGLLATVLEEAFEEYLARKQAVARTGDLIDDFAAGWDMHVQFGLANPLLYSALFASVGVQGRRVIELSASELRRELDEMDRAGLLRMRLDTAVSLTLAASVGCVLQLLRERGDADSPLSEQMREALLHQLCGTSIRSHGRGGTAQDLLADLSVAESALGVEESALFRKWLVRLRPDA